MMASVIAETVADIRPASDEASLVEALKVLPGQRWSTVDVFHFKDWLFRHKWKHLVRYAESQLSHLNQRQDAEDAWSTFCVDKLDSVLAEYDPKRGSPYSWVLFKFKFYCKDLNRHPTRRAQTATLPLDEVSISVFPQHDPRRAYEALDLLSTAMQSLSAQEKHLFSLRYIKEASYLDIAQILDVPIGTIRSRLSALRSKFKKELTRLSPAGLSNEG